MALHVSNGSFTIAPLELPMRNLLLVVSALVLVTSTAAFFGFH